MIACKSFRASDEGVRSSRLSRREFGQKKVVDLRRFEDKIKIFGVVEMDELLMD